MDEKKRVMNWVREEKWLRYSFYAMIMFVTMMLMIGEGLLPSEIRSTPIEDIRFKDAIYQVMEDGSVEEISVPNLLGYTNDGAYTLELTIPENIKDSDILVFWAAWQSVYVYVKDTGECIYEYGVSDSSWLGNNAASRYHTVFLSESLSGKTLVLNMESHSMYTGIVGEFYIGNTVKVWGSIVAMAIPVVVYALVLVLVGVGTTAISFVLGKFVYRRLLSLQSLGWTVTLTGIFLASQAVLRQFIFSNASWISYVSITVLYLIAFSQLLFINELQNLRHQNIYRIAMAYLIVSLMIVYVMHFCGIIDIIQNVPFIAIPSVALGLVTIYTFHLDKKNNLYEEYKAAAIGFYIYYISCVLELVFSVTPLAAYTGITMSVGLVIYLIIAVAFGVTRVVRTEIDRTNKIAEGEHKSSFLAQVSHEIRTPINGVLGMNEMIIRESSEENIKQYAYDIENLGNLLLAIINDLLDFSKIEAGKMDIMPIEYELSSTLDGVIASLRPKTEEKGLKFNIEVDEEIPEYLYGDEIRIRQIIMNIVNNAIKYTESGSVTLQVDKQVTDNRRINLIIKVTDTGKGIKEEDIPYLFDAFKRVEDKENSHIEGTGLGLAISAKFVELMNGRISVTSEYGKGSCFTVVIPQRVIKREAIGDFKSRVEKSYKERASYKESFTAPEARILVVDDNRTNLKLAELLLKKTRVMVVTALSGQETLDILEREKFDLILLDHMMPEMDGIQTLEKINERYPEREYPVIALTANAVAGAREKYLKQGFEDYMSKPINGKALEAMLIKWLPADKVEITKETEDE